MNNELYLDSRKNILQVLIGKNKWGGSHTHYKHMFSKIPKHQRGEKEVKTAADDLIREGRIMLKKTTEEEHVSLNPVYAQEIKQEAYYTKKE